MSQVLSLTASAGWQNVMVSISNHRGVVIAAFAVWIVLVAWAATLVSRAKIESLSERLLWYVVIFFMPFIGALLVAFRFAGGKPRASLDARMTDAIADAHRKTKKDNDAS
ncbi:MAG: hypothetical protein AAF270_12940 [Pseudomonadota bacterium]